MKFKTIYHMEKNKSLLSVSHRERDEMRMGHTVEQLLQPLKQGVVQGVHLPTGGAWGTLKVEGMLDRFLSGLPSGGVSTTQDGSLVDLEK